MRIIGNLDSVLHHFPELAYRFRIGLALPESIYRDIVVLGDTVHVVLGDPVEDDILIVPLPGHEPVYKRIVRYRILHSAELYLETEVPVYGHSVGPDVDSVLFPVESGHGGRRHKIDCRQDGEGRPSFAAEYVEFPAGHLLYHRTSHLDKHRKSQQHGEV